jgi:hypothetical protein
MASAADDDIVVFGEGVEAGRHGNGRLGERERGLAQRVGMFHVERS